MVYTVQINQGYSDGESMKGSFVVSILDMCLSLMSSTDIIILMVGASTVLLYDQTLVNSYWKQLWLYVW